MSGRPTTATPFLPGETGRVTVDLAALAANWRALAGRLAPGSACAAAVKADGYGLGLAQVLPTLEEAGCDTFFVATPDEGRAARALSETATVYVLNGLYPGAAPFYAEHRLRPVLGAMAEVAEWEDFCRATLAPPPAALHVDTGISRLGLSAEEARILAARGGPTPAPALLISHLACADTPAHPMNTLQRDRFQALADLFPGVDRSLANSAGIFLGPAFHHDLARPGIALYGGQAAGRDSRLAPVVTLEARVLQTHRLAKGAPIGYGATFTAPRDMTVAMIAAGYADGYLRAAGGSDAKPGAEVFARGCRLPVIGRVSMDMLAVDASALGPAALARGDAVELFGRHLPIDDVAARAGTIAYELLTGLGRRFARRYLPSAPRTGEA